MCDVGIIAALRPCGYVLEAQEYKYFALQCCFCEEKYGSWRTFIGHLREFHTSGTAEGRKGSSDESFEIEIDSSEHEKQEACENVVIELRSEAVEASNVDGDDANRLVDSIGIDDKGGFGFETTAAAEDKFLDESSNEESARLPTNDANCEEFSDEDTDCESSFYESDSSHSELEISDKEKGNEEKRVLNKFRINFVSLNTQTCDFIDCYREHPCLWDPSNFVYNDPVQCEVAFAEITKFFQEKYKVTPTRKNLNTAISRLQVFYKRSSFASKRTTEARKDYFRRCSFLAEIELDDRIQIKNISTKKITFGKTDQFTLAFVDICKKYPMLWDRNHPEYSLNSKRKSAYVEMINQLQERFDVSFSKEELYDSIHRLKQYYYNIQDKERRNEPLSKANLVYLECCKFLPPCKRKVQCHICERILRSEVTLQVHLLKQHNIGKLPFKCTYCELRFAVRTAVSEHEVRAHTKEFKWFCKFCNKGFASRRDMDLHELVHTGERKCVCEHCGKAFRLKHQMTEHVRIVHERDRCFKCTLCPKDFLRKRHLDDHMRGHLNIRDKVCPTCGKTFTNQAALIRHRQVHSEVKRYECKLCSERFHQFVGLSGHMKRKHKIVGTQLASDNNAQQLEPDIEQSDAP